MALTMAHRCLAVAGAAALLGITVARGESAPAEAPPGAFAVTDQAGGTVNAVATSDDLVFVGRGSRVVVGLADGARADPGGGAPRFQEIGRSEPLPGIVTDLAADNRGMLYALAGGLVVIDADDPTRPVVRAVAEVYSGVYDRRVQMHEGYAYVYGAQGVDVIDVRDPELPALVSEFGYNIWDLALNENLAVVTGPSPRPNEYGLIVYDISDPSRPRELAQLYYTTWIYPAVFYGGTLLVADGECNVRRVDLSVPEAPALGACIGTSLTERPQELVVVGDKIHALTGRYSTVEHYWIGDIEQDAIEWRVRYASGGATRLAVGARETWMVGVPPGADPRTTPQALHTIRIEQPLAVSSLGSVDLPGSAFRVTKWGDLAFVEDDSSVPVIHIVSLASPDAPSVISRVPGPGPLTTDGARLFAARYDEIEVLSLADPANPVSIGAVDAGGMTVGMALVDGRLAVTEGLVGECCSGVRIWDVSDPQSATLVGEVFGDWDAAGSIAHESYIYVMGEREVTVVSVSDPAQPAEVGRVSHFSPESMAVEGDTLFVASESGLSAYDISDPANPAESWSTDIDGLTSILGHADSLWMTHAPAGGLSVMDLTGSPDPGAVSLFEIERAYTSLAGSGGNLLVALEATQYGQSDAPVRLHVLGAAWPGRVSTSEFSQQTPVAAADVALLGDTLLVADPATGLLVLDAGEPGTELGRLELPGGARFVEAGRSWAAVVDAWTHAPDLDPGHPGHGDPVHRMHLVDLADPTSPRVADEVVAGYNAQVEAVGARVLLWAEGVASLYDVAPDTRFTPRGSLTYDAGSGYAHAALQGDNVYLATNWKLMVADVSDPDAPRWVAEVPFEPDLTATAIAVSGRLAAVGLTGSSGGRVRFGARLFDISNPERPVTVRDELGEQGDVFASLTAYEERLIAVGWTSVKQWDVSDFSWVKQVALMEAAGSPYRPADPGGNPTVPGFGPGPVVVDGGRAWMAAGGAGVLAADLPEGRLDVKIALPAVMTKR